MLPTISALDADVTVWRHPIAGRLHRDDGPALEHPTRGALWFHNGQLHRVDGPASVPTDRAPTWWLNYDQVSAARVVTRWLQLNHPATPAPVRATLIALAENWQPRDTMTALHAAALAAHT